MIERLRVLVVEDNPADVDLIREYMADSGLIRFQIDSVSCLSEAIARLNEPGVDLILIDLGLPDSQGLETFYKLQKAAPDTPTIILTGYDDEETAITAVRNGAQDYLIKGEIIGNTLVRAAQYAMERKRGENKEALARDVLATLNRPNNTINIIRDILQLVKKSTGVEAIGIRLREGDDFPYFQTSGFPDHFVEMERTLCARDEAGRIVRDTEGDPVLECMCGNILCGRTDPKHPFFTEGGSFWSNCTTELLASTTEQDRLARMRNHGGSEGYKSVALIPLRSGNKIIGLLQLNDHRRDQFTLEMIQFFEGIGAGIGIALSRMQAEDAIRASETRYRLLIENAQFPVVVVSAADLRVLFINEHASRLFGVPVPQAVGLRASEFWCRKEDLYRFVHLIKERDTVKDFETELQSKSGARMTGILSSNLIEFAGQQASLTVFQDITDRKKAEQAQRESEARFRIAQDMSPDGFTILRPVRDAQERVVDFIWVYENPAIARLNGTEPAAVVGRRLLELFPGHRDTPFLRAYQQVAESGETVVFEATYSGETISKPTSFRIVVVPMDGDIAILAQDITERKRVEEVVQASLREKEILLREIHHRVKNNMQIISSLFNLQSGHIKDEGARRMLKEGQLRIRSMALVHEKLYKSRDLSMIDFADYLRSLAEHLFQFFRVDADRIRLETDLEDVKLDVNSAVPCGLLVNELVSNALKHAFPEERKGVVGIRLHRREDGTVELRVADDGVGFPAAVDFRQTESFGLQIVSLLVGQLDGTIELDRKRGTAFTIGFRELQYKPRT